MKKYQIIGGQYKDYWHGESDSLHGAKIIASRCAEYWDNWQGWHTPVIYTADPVQDTPHDDYSQRARIDGARPFAYHDGHRWRAYREDDFW